MSIYKLCNIYWCRLLYIIKLHVNFNLADHFLLLFEVVNCLQRYFCTFWPFNNDFEKNHEPFLFDQNYKTRIAPKWGMKKFGLKNRIISRTALYRGTTVLRSVHIQGNLLHLKSFPISQSLENCKLINAVGPRYNAHRLSRDEKIST